MSRAYDDESELTPEEIAQRDKALGGELVVTVGQYRTRGGSVAKVHRVIDTGAYPCLGTIGTGASTLHRTWSRGGRYRASSEHDWDLVERIGRGRKTDKA